MKKNSLFKSRKIIAAIASGTVFVLLFILIIQNKSQEKNYWPAIPTFVINNSIYEIVAEDEFLSAYGTTRNEVLAKHGLQQNIKPEMVGDYIGTVSYNGNIHKVYDFKNFFGESVVVLENDGMFQYLLFCNYSDNKIIAFRDLFQLHGFSSVNDITQITVGKEKITDKNKIENIAEVLLNANAITWNQYLETNEIKTTHPVSISLFGVNTDTIYFDFYQKEGVIETANTIYLLSEEDTELLASFK